MNPSRDDLFQLRNRFPSFQTEPDDVVTNSSMKKYRARVPNKRTRFSGIYSVSFPADLTNRDINIEAFYSCDSKLCVC